MMKRAIAAALSFAFATTILTQTTPPPSKEDAAKSAPPGQGIRKLSKRQRGEKINGLDVRFQDFLADVEPILLPTEIDPFLILDTDAQRDAFIDDFWHRRDVMQGVGNRAFRDMYYARLEIAKSQFRKIGSDRAKMFLLHGPPAGVVRTECASLLVPIEIWKYAQIPGFGYNVRLLFYRPRGTNDYKLWNPIGGNLALAELMMQDSAAFARPADDTPPRRQPSDSLSPYSSINRIQLECRDGDEILRAINEMVQSRR